MTSVDVIGVGDADIDIYLELDHVPRADEKIVATGYDLQPGGMIVNFLVALRRLGWRCGCHGLVGDDDFGRLVLTNLATNDIDSSGVVVLPGERSFFCVVMLDRSGEKALTVVPTRCTYPRPEDLVESALFRARHLHTTAANVETLSRLIQVTQRYNQSVSLDIEPGQISDLTHLRSLLSHVNVLFANERAARQVAGTDSLEDVGRAMGAFGVGATCVTLGARGAIVFSGADAFRIPAFEVPVVDTTGAGDCFAAGFVHGFLKNWPLQRAATFASAVGALSVTRRGGHSGAPSLGEATSFLAARGIVDPSGNETAS